MTVPLRVVAPVLLAGALLAPVFLSLHAAHARRAARSAQHDVAAIAPWLPGPDLALAGGARHLRSLSQTEPAAAFSDAPASLDTDPGGGAFAPPRDVWKSEAR